MMLGAGREADTSSAERLPWKQGFLCGSFALTPPTRGTARSSRPQEGPEGPRSRLSSSPPHPAARGCSLPTRLPGESSPLPPPPAPAEAPRVPQPSRAAFLPPCLPSSSSSQSSRRLLEAPRAWHCPARAERRFLCATGTRRAAEQRRGSEPWTFLR